MCFFVTIGVRGESVTELEDSLPRGLALHPVANGSVLRELPAEYRTYVLTSGICSCDLFRAPASPKKEAAETHAAHLRRKYAKRRWSATKIERAVAQATARPEPAESFIGLRPDVRELLANLAEEVGDLAIVVHWYNGDIETEKFHVFQGTRILSTEFREGSVCLTQDVVVQVRGLGRTSR